MDNRDRPLWIVIAVLVLIFLLGPGLGWGMMGPGMMAAWGGAFSPWWSVAMLVFWVAIIAGIVLLVVWGIRQTSPHGGASRGPLEILKERYARGEITRDQYKQVRHDLE